MAVGPAPPETSLALDNDIFTHWRNHSPSVQEAINEYQSRHKVIPALTSTTVFEALRGIEAEAAKNKDVERYKVRAQQLIQNCIVLPFDQDAAAIAAYIFPRIPKNKINELWRDVFIAATVLAHRYGIATGNRKDFELIARHLPPTHAVLHLAIWNA